MTGVRAIWRGFVRTLAVASVIWLPVIWWWYR
jgi:hypothetical protein